MIIGAGAQCVVLDIDDTLYLERDYIRSGFRAVETNLEIAGLAHAAWSLFLAGVRGDTFDRALATLGIPADPDLVHRMVSCYRDHDPMIGLLPDVSRWLQTIDPAIRLACVSDGAVPSQRAKVEALGLRTIISDVVLTGEYGPGFGKPHPRAFYDVARRSGLAPGEHIYVADNPRKDFDGPRALGWRSVRVRRPGALHIDLPTPAFVDHEVVGFDALATVISLPWCPAALDAQVPK